MPPAYAPTAIRTMPRSGAIPRAFAQLGNPKIGAEIRSARLPVRDAVEITAFNDLDSLIGKRLTEIAHLLRVYAVWPSSPQRRDRRRTRRR